MTLSIVYLDAGSVSGKMVVSVLVELKVQTWKYGAREVERAVVFVDVQRMGVFRPEAEMTVEFSGVEDGRVIL